MFSSKKVVIDIHDVPINWIFEYYLRLPSRLMGRDVKIKSVFNIRDRVPSMSVYFNTKYNVYQFNCFSTGIKGSAIDLVKHMFNLNYPDALDKIIRDYKLYISDNPEFVQPQFEVQKWQMDSYDIRPWSKKDATYWSQYNISSDLLEKYKVRPLRNFCMTRGSETFVSNNNMTFGYFTKDEKIYKIYRPQCDTKFLTLFNYIQGWDQLQNHDTLFICSSLKDMMSMESLGFVGDYIAPHSEVVGVDDIIEWVKQYPNKYTIFDNDDTGLRSMIRHKERYEIPYLHVQMEKDISDSVKVHGAKKVRVVLKSLL